MEHRTSLRLIWITASILFTDSLSFAAPVDLKCIQQAFREFYHGPRKELETSLDALGFPTTDAQRTRVLDTLENVPKKLRNETIEHLKELTPADREDFFASLKSKLESSSQPEPELMLRTMINEHNTILKFRKLNEIAQSNPEFNDRVDQQAARVILQRGYEVRNVEDKQKALARLRKSEASDPSINQALAKHLNEATKNSVAFKENDLWLSEMALLRRGAPNPTFQNTVNLFDMGKVFVPQELLRASLKRNFLELEKSNADFKAVIDHIRLAVKEGQQGDEFLAQILRGERGAEMKDAALLFVTGLKIEGPAVKKALGELN